MIRLLSSTALKPTLDEVLETFETKVGERVATVFAPSAQIRTRITEGAEVDLVALTAVEADILETLGRLRSAGRQNIASSIIGLAVRADEPPPDISNVAAFRRTMLSAMSVATSNPNGGGVSGAHMQAAFSGLGIADAMQPKLIYSRGGPDGLVGLLVRDGQAQIGIQQVPELRSVSGIDVVDAIPAELQLTTTFTLAYPTAAAASEPARQLANFLASDAVRSVFVAKGMGPP